MVTVSHVDIEKVYQVMQELLPEYFENMSPSDITSLKLASESTLKLAENHIKDIPQNEIDFIHKSKPYSSDILNQVLEGITPDLVKIWTQTPGWDAIGSRVDEEFTIMYDDNNPEVRIWLHKGISVSAKEYFFLKQDYLCDDTKCSEFDLGCFLIEAICNSIIWT